MSDGMCPRGCGWSERGSDRHHSCHSAVGPLPTNTRVSAPARDGGRVFGSVIRSQNGLTGGVDVSVKWDGARSATWTTPDRLTVIVESGEVAA
jgi:hypothetical protein